MSLVLASALLLVAPADSRGDSRLRTLNPGVLQVCLYPGFAPFTSKDGKGEWTGWDVSYLDHFAASERLRFQPVEVTRFDGIWTLPAGDVCDVAAAGISDTQDRRAESGARAAWSQHYYRVLRAFLVRSQDAHGLNSIADLRDRTVIVTGNATADSDIQHRLARAGITTTTILTTFNEVDAAREVLDGQSFAYAGGLGSVQHLAAQLGGLAVTWPHCNMLADGSEVDEPFSFVVRSASTGVIAALDRFISDPATPYPGKSAFDPGCSEGSL
ncbi:substrate-binding periplasmic protein [Mycobacterium basiliense]|nr:transporter substrate-binding domain-containing protein [Mycobacterium basiliense]